MLLHHRRLQRVLGISLVLLWSAPARAGTFPDYQHLTGCPLHLRWLPGAKEFVFTMYGTPGTGDELKQLVKVMQEQHLGNGFDPGPSARAASKPLFDYLATVRWPVMAYPGCADMQIKGGNCVLGPQDKAALGAMDAAGVFNAIQLGEWGYYFHNLAPDERWWHDVYGPDFEKMKHFMRPAGLAGYDTRPASKREAYEVVKDYFTSRSHDLLDRVISVTGHSHYESYAAEWGARCIGLELGENIAFSQSKLAFARGASRQWNKPFSVQVSPWFSGACTTSGPLRGAAQEARGLDAGHSLSFYERMWLHAWFAGAAMVTPENSIAIFFEQAAAPWSLTSHGKKASEVFQFMRSHERGVPWTPVAILVDHYAGYNAYMDKPWGILQPTEGDHELRDLFDHQLFPGSDHIHVRPDPKNPEVSYLRPTPYGESFDVLLTSVGPGILPAYPVILLAGDIEMDDALVARLQEALAGGSTVLIHPRHRQALGDRFAALARKGHLEVLEPGLNPDTGRPAAISPERLEHAVRDNLPITVTGDPVQYQINRVATGWVVELVNDSGVMKKPAAPAVVDEKAIQRVVLKPKPQFASARSWVSGKTWQNPAVVELELGPGKTEFVEFVSGKPATPPGSTPQPSGSAKTGSADSEPWPARELNPVLAAPIRTWDEAVPLGNGLLGGLLWGENETVRLSLDRGDLWDERPAVEKEWWKKRTYALMQQLVHEKKFDQINQLFDSPYNGVTPTKLPAGRLEITLAPGQRLASFELDLGTAKGIAHLTNGRKLEAFFSAGSPVALLRIPGAEPKALNLLTPLEVHRKRSGADSGPSSGGSVDRLGYPDAKSGANGRAQWYLQQAAEGLTYCVCVESARPEDETLLAITLTSTRDGPDPLSIARERCASALRTGFEGMRRPHLAWWKDFWSQSAVHVPELDIQRQYTLVQYFYGAASRRHAPPMPLQGVWTADSGGLPPWKGDYHNDLNTQMTYIAYQQAGHFEEGAAFLDLLWELLPRFREFAHDFYGTPGAAVPGVMSLAGQPLGGWGQYSLSPTMGAWTAHLFYLHWRYTGDDRFLRERAYPWCKEIAECLRGLLKPNAVGVPVLPLSTSPEIFDNSGRAWLEPNSNFDLACLKMLFLSLAEMASARGQPAEAGEWRATAASLGDFHTKPDGTLLVDAHTPLPYSHRHLSNLMGIHPFNLINVENGPADRQRINASLAQWDQLGPSQWCGYSYSWMSCLRARVGDPESAVRDLDVFVKAFLLRNGFHANGDQSGRGFSGMTYRPFTLEGNFLAAQAVHEMLLQSWSPTPGQPDTEVLRLFPATPWRWHDVSFEHLRAEGGHRVSARRENNATTWFEIASGKEGVVRIRDNFGGRTPEWNRRDVRKLGDCYEISLKKGELVSATLSRPAEVPPTPDNLAAPVVIRK